MPRTRGDAAWGARERSAHVPTPLCTGSWGSPQPLHQGCSTRFPRMEHDPGTQSSFVIYEYHDPGTQSSLVIYELFVLH